VLILSLRVSLSEPFSAAATTLADQRAGEQTLEATKS